MLSMQLRAYQNIGKSRFARLAIAARQGVWMYLKLVIGVDRQGVQHRGGIALEFEELRFAHQHQRLDALLREVVAAVQDLMAAAQRTATPQRRGRAK